MPAIIGAKPPSLTAGKLVFEPNFLLSLPLEFFTKNLAGIWPIFLLYADLLDLDLFGMAGDRPPAGAGGFFGSWWRPGGDISRPLLANPTFRKHFLARTKDLLAQVHTEEAIGPVIKAVDQRLAEEVKYRAEVRREDAQRAVEHFRKNLDSLRRHLTLRRAFLLKQNEIQQAGKYDPKGLQ